MERLADFETGDLLQFDTTATDGGQFQAHVDAAMEGVYGGRYEVDDANSLYGQFTLDNKSQLRFGFYFDPNNLGMADGDEFTLACDRWVSNDYRLQFRYDDPDYKMRVDVWDDGAGWQSTATVVISDEPHWIEVHVRRATAPGANDGFAKIWVDPGLPPFGAPDAERTDIDDDTLDHDSFRVGMVTGRDAGTSGIFYVDYVVLNDTGDEIGPPEGGVPPPTPTTPITGAFAPCRWQVVVPEATTNLISHPSVEDAAITSFTAANGATRVQSSAQSRWGLYSLGITPHAVNTHSGVYYQVTGAATTTYTFSVWILGTASAIYTLRIMDGAFTELAVQSFIALGTWQRIDITGTTLANVTVRCCLTANAAGGATFYADGWQLEQKAYRTTYCDGDRDGCEWAAVPHASTSSRSAQSRAGGRVRDLQTDYGLQIGAMTDFGAPPMSLTVDEYAILPGGEQSSVKVHPRAFTIAGVINGSSTLDLHSKRQALATLFDPEAYPGEQPILFRYTGAIQERELAAYYQSGLEASLDAEEPCFWERVAIQFIADKPFWYEVGETSWLLDHTDPDTFRYMMARLRSTGQWSNLGLTANPVGGTGFIYALTWGPDGRLYAGGDFTGLNGTVGAASIDYIGCWNPLTNTWSQVGAAGALNATVRVIKFDSTGLMHVGGDFTNAGAVGAADYLATWDGANWGAVGTPGEVAGRQVHDMAWNNEGTLVIVGIFVTWAGVANCDYVAAWNGVNWYALGVPVAGAAAITAAHAIAIDSQNTIYIGGDFVNWANIANADHIVQRYGGTWYALGTLVLDASVQSLTLRPGDEMLHLGGQFTTFGGNTLNRVGLWNGHNFEPLGSGLNQIVYEIKFGPDGKLLIVGSFGTTGDGLIVFPQGYCAWDGTTFEILDVNGPGAAGHCHYAMEIGSVDPILKQNYDVFISFAQTGAALKAGTITATNGGTELMFPMIRVSRDGGTRGSVVSIRNETTGRMIRCDCWLLDDERIDIDLEPTKKTITSSYFGSRPDVVQAASDFGSFALQVGSNQITCYVEVIGATVVAWMVGRTMYAGQD